MAELSPLNLGQFTISSVEQRLHELEARIVVLERHGHDIPLSTVNEITEHTIHYLYKYLVDIVASATPPSLSSPGEQQPVPPNDDGGSGATAA